MKNVSLIAQLERETHGASTDGTGRRYYPKCKRQRPEYSSKTRVLVKDQSTRQRPEYSSKTRVLVKNLKCGGYINRDSMTLHKRITR